MASTGKTKNLGLCQWEATDPFLREDMNGDFARIDEAVGSRLELELLRDLELNTRLMNQVDIDVSDVDFGSYMFFIVDFRYVQGCYFRLNNFNISTVENGAKYIFLPLKNPSSNAACVRIREQSITAGFCNLAYSKIDTIRLVCYNDFTHADTTKLAIWGVK